MAKRSNKAGSDRFSQPGNALFTRELLDWDQRENDRRMPWKGERDPYKIWLSEIILQQTRVEQGWKYYEKFTTAYPDIHALAGADDAEIFKMWEGLGYYSRCRNLIATARYISTELNGRFPSRYDDIIALKGVGSYTAAAIASFAFNLPHAVVDGNVYRVLSRIYGTGIPTDSTEGKKYFNELATKLLPPHDASAFNQAIMDFGATVCRPVPECNRCFFSRNCVAYLRGTQHQFPVKKKKPVTATRWLNYIVVRNRNYVAVRQRTGSDIWNQLHEFVLIETPGLREASHVIDMFRQQFGVQQVTLEKSIQKTQKLTHQKLYLQFNVVTLTTRPAWPDFAWVDTRKLDEQAFPVTLKRFIADHLA